MVNFFTALKNGFTNYVNFKGRIRRSEYWFFMLVINLITFVLILLTLLYAFGIITVTKIYKEYIDYPYDPYNPYYTDKSIYDDIKNEIEISYDNSISLIILLVLTIYVILIMLPVLSATARRLHDIGKNGEYIFIGLVPFFGGLSLLVLLCQDSMQNKNKYGPSPKYVISDIDKNLYYKEVNSSDDKMVSDNNFVTPLNLNSIN